MTTTEASSGPFYLYMTCVNPAIVQQYGAMLLKYSALPSLI